MSGLNVNCFGQCLNSLEDDGDNPQIFKTRKGRKCLTLVRRGKALPKGNNMQSNPSTAIENIQLQSIQLHPLVPSSHVTIRHITNETPQTISHPHVIYGRYSTGPSVDQIQNHYYLPPNIYVQRQRRLSEANSGSYQPMLIPRQERSTSLEHNKLVDSRKDSRMEVTTTQPSNNHFIEIIREEIQNEKRSSLFQGAKSILSKLASSHKNSQKRYYEPIILQTVQKTNNFEIRSFYENARLCQTQHAINNTHSTIKTQRQQISHLNLTISRELSIDEIPMSPKSKNTAKYKDIKTGKLLGVGKWAHVYLCQQAKTNLIYSFKQIFKQSLQFPVTVDKIHEHLKHMMRISHPKIISIYSKIETNDKICIITQYCMRSIYEELKTKGKFTIKQIKSYLADMVQGLVYLHQNDYTHGNINIFSIFINFSECKIKPNFIEIAQETAKTINFKSDIISLAIVIHQMAYGVSNHVSFQQTLYEKEKHYKQPNLRKILVDSIKIHLHEQQSQNEYTQLNAFIMMLLNWSQDIPLTSCVCLTHPFLAEEARI